LRRSEATRIKAVIFPPRQHPRVYLATDVRVEGHDLTFTARSVQLGTKGMSLEDADQLSLAQPVELAFALPSGCSLRIGAVVWWKKENLTGLRFDPRGDYPAIQEWIETENGTAFSGHCDSGESHSPERHVSLTRVEQNGGALFRSEAVQHQE
jgi:hypothetical protein